MTRPLSAIVVGALIAGAIYAVLALLRYNGGNLRWWFYDRFWLMNLAIRDAFTPRATKQHIAHLEEENLRLLVRLATLDEVRYGPHA